MELRSSKARRLLHRLSGDHLRVLGTDVSLKVVLPRIAAETNLADERSWIVHGLVSFQVMIPTECARALNTLEWPTVEVLVPNMVVQMVCALLQRLLGRIRLWVAFLHRSLDRTVADHAIPMSICYIRQLIVDEVRRDRFMRAVRDELENGLSCRELFLTEASTHSGRSRIGATHQR